jgi:hypothetical protein
MTLIRQTFLVTLKIDTFEAQNFPTGFRDPKIYGDNGYNRDSYPNWDLTYLGNENEFIEMMWEDFQRSFDCDGLNCLINRVRNDE